MNRFIASCGITLYILCATLGSAVLISQLAGQPVYAAGIGLDKELYPQGLATPNRTDPTKSSQASTTDAIRIAVTQHFVEIVLGIAATVAMFFILNNGFWMITSAGGEKVEEAKKGLTWALVGLVLIILSYSIIRFVISIPLSADERTNTPAATGTK